jgi:hypothetical protein
MNKDSAREIERNAVRFDGDSATSSITNAAASWLDERIAEERKRYIGTNGTAAADREAKEKARASARTTGSIREPSVLLRGTAGKEPGRHAPIRSGSNRQEEGAMMSVPPQKPSRSNGTIVNNSVRSALDDLEKDVLQTMQKTSPKATVSPKSLKSINNQESAFTKLQTMEQDLVAKTRARATTSGMVTTKRDTPPLFTQREEDMAAKTKARGGASNAAITKRVNTFEADADAKARARSKPAETTVTKRSNTLEVDMTGVVSKRLNQLEVDLDAKARAQASSSIVANASKRLNQLDTDVEAKNRARSSNANGPIKNSPSPGAIGIDGYTSRTGAVSTLSKEMDDIIAYKTGISLSNPELPDDLRVVARPKVNSSEVLSTTIRKTDFSMNKEGAVPQEYAHLTGEHNDFHFGMSEYSDDEEAGRLAVAVAVKDYEGEDVFIPSAVEYDPDAKPPMYKNRRFRMYGLLGCILIIILLACAIGILAIQEKNDTVPTLQIPTTAPTCQRCSIGIEEQLELEVGSEKLYDLSTSEFLAKQWIINEDPLQLVPEDANLVQRFLLATFYYESHKLGNWRSCNKQGDEDPDETCSFLRITKIYPREYEGVPGIRWLSSKHECQWAGLNCDEFNQTRVIDLPGQDIEGTFPAILTRLPYVQTITLAWNNFIGQLPDSIGNMNHLLNFEVQYNQFTGNIPLTWSNAKNLQLVNFGGNMLSGQLPTEVGYLRNIKGIFLYENIITGTFPDEFAQVSLLSKCQFLPFEFDVAPPRSSIFSNITDLFFHNLPAYARFQRNMLSGTIPTYLGDMRLNEFWINRNPVKGTIPSELGYLSNHMFDLRLFDTNLEGTIPEEIYELTSLWRFDLNEANFNGTISSNIGKLQSLSVFRINDNSFTGTLPTEFNSLPSLNTVQLDRNQFSGTVPIEICETAPNETLKFLQADCLPDPVSGLAMVTCDCCHSCCNPDLDECVDNV